MWFAPLTDANRNPWFLSLLHRILQNSKPVLALLESNPFEGQKPKFVRALTKNFQFTENSDSGQWWSVEEKGVYVSSVGLGNEKWTSLVGRYEAPKKTRPAIKLITMDEYPTWLPVMWIVVIVSNLLLSYL
jgi:hypothetical protein